MNQKTLKRATEIATHTPLTIVSAYAVADAEEQDFMPNIMQGIYDSLESSAVQVRQLEEFLGVERVQCIEHEFDADFKTCLRCDGEGWYYQKQ